MRDGGIEILHGLMMSANSIDRIHHSVYIERKKEKIIEFGSQT